MSALAQKHQAINLSQGFPDFDGPRYLHERLAYHVAQGANQYAPMTGAQALREAIADKTAEIYGYRPDDVSDITVTAGATEALYARLPRWCGQGMRLSVSIPVTTAMPRPWRSPAEC
ncbi:aminotransferase [Salmonella enterica subsp. enterica]|uniref:Aminotransferase n=1 Tax=Salmonella enterica I TaxID=59201 RepID=A0A379UL36_SALET|nr:aminotransferase [Salmonella enterica subsp. enterica]